MTTVSIYDDIDPIKKETAAPVSLYDELDIPSNTNNTTDISPTIPTVTATSTYPPNNIPNTNTNTSNTNQSNIIKSVPSTLITPQIINNQNTNTNTTQLYNPPPANDHIDPSLTGVPLQHLATYKSHVLYVGGIQWWVTDADIRRTFDQFGTIIDVKIHADKVNGKSKGYGYVEFDQRELEAAVIAKQKLHGHILSDCRISVAFASPERAKGAEYTNTPVHIPRHKINQPIAPNTSTTNNILPKLNVLPTHHPNVMSSHSHNVLAAINARNTIGNNNLLLNNSLNKPRTNITHSHSHIRKNNNNTNANANATNSNNNNSSGNAPATNTNNTNTIGLLSKFTDQAQLLALLNKTSNVNGSSRSRSITGSRSGSRSPRSRSRSKHSRRRRHGSSRKKRRHEREGRDGRENRHRNRTGGGDIMSGNSGGDRERDRKRRHKRRHRHRDRGDREYREHRERRKRNRNNNNNEGNGKDIGGDDGGKGNTNVSEEIPVTNIAVGGNVKMNVDQKGDEDE